MVTTAYYLAQALRKKKYDLVLNAGIAGSFSKDIPLGSVVNVVEECFSDMGAEDDNNFIHVSEMDFEGDAFPLKNKFSTNKIKLKNKTLSYLQKVRGITVNTVHGNEKSIAKVKKLFNPGVETMEGAAVFYVCGKVKIPCIQVRAISNYVEKRNKKNWKTQTAINNLNNTLQILFEELYQNKK